MLNSIEPFTGVATTVRAASFGTTVNQTRARTGTAMSADHRRTDHDEAAGEGDTPSPSQAITAVGKITMSSRSAARKRRLTPARPLAPSIVVSPAPMVARI